MSKVLVIILSICVAVCAIGVSVCVYTSYETDFPVQVIAHRGFWNTEMSAQNSLSALLKADEIMCYGSECDVHLTVDNRVIVIHGPSHGTTISDVRKATFSDIRDIPLDNNELVPSFEDYLDTFLDVDNTKLIIELKDTGDSNRNIILTRLVVSMVSSYGVENRVEYISFSKQICELVLCLCSDATVYYLNGDLSPEEVKNEGFAGLDYHLSVLMENTHWIEEAHKLGLLVNVWTVNSQEDIQWAIDNNVDYITTDNPELVLSMVNG